MNGGFADASFASDAEFTSRLGFVISIVDASDIAEIVQYSSSKSKRVAVAYLPPSPCFRYRLNHPSDAERNVWRPGLTNYVHRSKKLIRRNYRCKCYCEEASSY